MKIGELVDKYTIEKLYTERLDSLDHQKEFQRLARGLGSEKAVYSELPWDDIINLMYQINGFIWDFESPIHLGKLDVDPIMAGVLALRVRKLNTMRVTLSNLIDRIVKK